MGKKRKAVFEDTEDSEGDTDRENPAKTSREYFNEDASESDDNSSSEKDASLRLTGRACIFFVIFLAYNTCVVLLHRVFSP